MIIHCDAGWSVKGVHVVAGIALCQSCDASFQGKAFSEHYNSTLMQGNQAELN